MPVAGFARGVEIALVVGQREIVFRQRELEEGLVLVGDGLLKPPLMRQEIAEQGLRVGLGRAGAHPFRQRQRLTRDLDGVSDAVELEGFSYNGRMWYGNPLAADSNRDGIGDDR